MGFKDDLANFFERETEREDVDAASVVLVFVVHNGAVVEDDDCYRPVEFRKIHDVGFKPHVQPTSELSEAADQFLVHAILVWHVYAKDLVSQVQHANVFVLDVKLDENEQVDGLRLHRAIDEKLFEVENFLVADVLSQVVNIDGLDKQVIPLFCLAELPEIQNETFDLVLLAAGPGIVVK